MNNKYELRIYDKSLLTFELILGEHKNYEITIKSISESKELFPLGMELTGEGILKWLNRRIIPKNRAYVHNILNALGLSLRDTKGIIDVCKGLSLNDSFWVVPEGFDGKFADYNLYENRFSEILAMTALTGERLSENKVTQIHTSPEFTTNGMLPKAWRYYKGKIILFKGGAWRQFATALDPLEPYSEYYAAQIADAMELNPVKYGLSRWKNVFGCTCNLFTNINTSYVPMADLVRQHINHANTSKCYAICGEWFKAYDDKNDTNFFDYFASMLIFDSLILNEDRHLGNFGVLRDNHSGKIIGNAPIFDNGSSLFNYSSIQELRRIDTHKQGYTNYFNQSFDMQAKEFGGALQIEQLSKLSNFRFKKHNQNNWDLERMGIIQDFINKRAVELIGIIHE